MSQEELSNTVGEPSESYEAGKLERVGREVTATALQAAAVLTLAFAAKDSSWDTRLLAVGAAGGIGAIMGISLKENGEKGLIKTPLGEVMKVSLLGAAAAFAVDHPDVVMPMLEQIGKTTANVASNATEVAPQLPLKTALALGGLALLGWKGRDIAVGTYDLAAAGVEAGKEAAVHASREVVSRIATKFQGGVNKMYEYAGKEKIDKGEPVNASSNDFLRNPEDWDSVKSRLLPVVTEHKIGPTKNKTS